MNTHQLQHTTIPPKDHQNRFILSFSPKTSFVSKIFRSVWLKTPISYPIAYCMICHPSVHFSVNHSCSNNGNALLGETVCENGSIKKIITLWNPI